MANLVATNLTYTVINEDSVTETGPGPSPASPGSARARHTSGGTRHFKTYHCTILIPTSGEYPTGGVPISGVSSEEAATKGQLVAANALANPSLGCFTHVEDVVVLSNGNAAGLDDAFLVLFDRGTQGTTPHKLRILTNSAGGADARLAEHSNAALAEALTVYCLVTGY